MPRVKILVDGQVRDIAAGDLVPANMLTGAAISFSPSDRILVNGLSVPIDVPIQSGDYFILQLRRALPVTIFAPNGQVTISTAAYTVGEALHEAGITSLGARDKVDLYLLTAPDVPFVQDGLRDGEHIREWMDQRFMEQLARGRTPVVRLSGGYAQRFAKAVAAVERLLGMVTPQ